MTAGPDWSNVLMDALLQVPDQYQPGALAYLAATSKVEMPVRDAIATVLHRRLTNHIVSREWSRDRRDLAVLDQQGSPLMLLEAKALYGFDVFNERSRGNYLTGTKFGLAKDALSLHVEAALGRSCYLLSLMTQPMAKVPEMLVNVIKYGYHHNIALAKHGGDPQALLAASERWAKDLLLHGPLVGHVQHALGTVHGVPILLDCHLVGPLIPIP